MSEIITCITNPYFLNDKGYILSNIHIITASVLAAYWDVRNNNLYDQIHIILMIKGYILSNIHPITASVLSADWDVRDNNLYYQILIILIIYILINIHFNIYTASILSADCNYGCELISFYVLGYNVITFQGQGWFCLIRNNFLHKFCFRSFPACQPFWS